MNNSAYLIRNAFLNHLPEEKKRRFFSYLEEPETNTNIAKLDLKLFSSDSLFFQVHYSWFLPTLQSYPKADIPLFLNALNETDRFNLKKILDVSLPKRTLSKTGKKFLKSLLYQSLHSDYHNLLPVKYLPSNLLKNLAFFSKNELTKFIQYLSLFDLAQELRHIVDPKILKKIKLILSEQQRDFLKKIVQYREGFFHRLGLERWDGDEETLKTLLHRRGLQRLSAALQEQHPDLIWYIAHHLDIGRGNALLKFCEKKVTSNVVQSMMQNIEDVVMLFEKKS